jgi:hypothetical protein
MAVRDDFAPGEVLAAADLNDTFASKLPYSYGTATPSTTDSGFLWYDSNSTPAAPKFWDGSAFKAFPAGLTYLHTETFSSVSSVSISSKLSSTYDYYLVMWNITCTSDDFLLMRLRSGSTDNSATNYDYQRNSSFDSTYSAASSANQTSMQVGRVRSTGGSGVLTIFNPALAQTTYMVASAGHSGQFTDIRGLHDVSTAFDGLTFIPNAGTMTGTIRLYGYANA